jgi:hypothetical protein
LTSGPETRVNTRLPLHHRTTCYMSINSNYYITIITGMFMANTEETMAVITHGLDAGCHCRSGRLECCPCGHELGARVHPAGWLDWFGTNLYI